MSKPVSPPDPAWDHAGWIWYFRKDLTDSVRNDIGPLVPRGLFGVPRQFFPYVEYLSGLVFGPVPTPSPRGIEKLASTGTATKFLEDYMGRVYALYRTHSKLLIEMWRHGLVHTYKPKILESTVTGRLLGWTSYSGPRTNVAYPSHLTIYADPLGIHDALPVSIDCLVEDLERVLDLLATDVEAEHAAGGTMLLDQMRRAAQHLEKAVQVDLTW